MLKFYPDHVPDRIPRLAGDMLATFWGVAWVAAGWTVYRVVEGLQTVSDGLTGTGRTLNSWIQAFRAVVPGGIPGLSSLFGNVATTLQRDSGDQLIALGGQAHASVDTFALVLGLITAVPPIVIVCGAYLIWRWRDAREMGAALMFVRTAERSGRIEEARALLAYRAMAQLSFDRLMRASADPVGDVVGRRYDALASAMLRRAGLESFRLHDPGPRRLDSAPPSAPDVGDQREQEHQPRPRAEGQEGRFGPGHQDQ
jgi:hypothetical protein